MTTEQQLERIIEIGETTNRLLTLLMRRLDVQAHPPHLPEPFPFGATEEVPYEAIRRVLADPKTLVTTVAGGFGRSHSRVLMAPDTWLKVEHDEWGAVQAALVYPDGSTREVDAAKAGLPHG